MTKLIIILLLVSVHVGMAQKTVDQCITCHKAIGDKPSRLFSKDLHSAQGISCADCHGGNASKDDMEESMNKNAGFIGIPRGDKVSEVCSNCHSDQLGEMNKSVHGKLTVKGDQKILQCTTCHSVHNIVPVKNAASPVHASNVVQTCSKCHSDISYMRQYNPALPTDQHEKYLTSVHGVSNKKKDTKAATCASCHGSHDIKIAKDIKSHVHPANLPK
ncbi:MAG: cytochrome c3 family protein, partial [Bacteroidota bacterium]|nr:cytochrome c3 family protein [Bacteroidota bacterium]